MKFTKDDARKELSARMTAKGEKLNLSERSLNEQLDTLMPLLANEETELIDFVDKVLPIFKTADANVRNDVSAGIKDYEAKKNEQGGTQGQENGGKAQEPSPLEKRLAELEAKLANADREARVKAKQAEVIAKLKEKGVKDRDWANALLSEIAIDENFDVDAKVASFVSLYNKAHSGYDPDATPGQANGGGGESKKELDDLMKEAAVFVAGSDLHAK